MFIACTGTSHQSRKQKIRRISSTGCPASVRLIAPNKGHAIACPLLGAIKPIARNDLTLLIRSNAASVLRLQRNFVLVTLDLDPRLDAVRCRSVHPTPPPHPLVLTYFYSAALQGLEYVSVCQPYMWRNRSHHRGHARLIRLCSSHDSLAPARKILKKKKKRSYSVQYAHQDIA